MRGSMRGVLAALAGLALLGWALPWMRSGPAGLEAARREGTVVVYAAFDRSVAQPLVADFEALYPGVRVDLRDMSTTAVYERLRADTAAGRAPDVAWSSAMDLQIKLVNDGYAQPHHSDETAALPRWAVWRDEAFGTTFEPAAVIYNRRLLRADEVPATHPALLRLLSRRRAELAGRVTTYDPERSGVGFLLQTQDELANPVVFWSLARAFGEVRVNAVANTSDMIEAVATGRAVLGYNALGTYALTYARKDPRVGVRLLEDYTLVMSRVIFIARGARHPNAARLWVDYVLSRRGQERLVREGDLFSVREDMPAAVAARELRNRLGTAARPISLGTGLITYLDRMKQRDFLYRWNIVTVGP